MVYVADPAAGAGETLAGLRALDGFVFIVAEPAAPTHASGRAGLPEARASRFESRVLDPAERPPDC